MTADTQPTPEQRPQRRRWPRALVVSVLVGWGAFGLLTQSLSSRGPATVDFPQRDGLDAYQALVRPVACPGSTLFHHNQWFVVTEQYFAPSELEESEQMTMYVINAETGELAHEVMVPSDSQHCGFNPEGFLVTVHQYLQTPPDVEESRQDVAVTYLDPRSGETHERIIQSRSYAANEEATARVSADSTTLVTLTSDGSKAHIDCFDLKTGRQTATFTLPRDATKPEWKSDGYGSYESGFPDGSGSGHWHTANTLRTLLAVSPNGRHLAVWGIGDRLEVFSLPRGDLVTRLVDLPLPDPELPPLKPNSEWVPCGLNFTPNGQNLVARLLSAEGDDFRQLDVDSIWYSLPNDQWTFREVLPPQGDFDGVLRADVGSDFGEPRSIYSPTGATAAVLMGHHNARRLRLHSTDGAALAKQLLLPIGSEENFHRDLRMVNEVEALLVTSEVHDSDLLDWVPGLDRQAGETGDPFADDRLKHRIRMRNINLLTGEIRNLGTFPCPLHQKLSVRVTPTKIGILIHSEDRSQFLTRSMTARARWPGPVCLVLAMLVFALQLRPTTSREKPC